MEHISKGEWSVIEGKDNSLLVIRTLPNGGVDRICSMAVPSTGYRIEVEANAHLIAKSPKMYGALEKIAVLLANPLTTRQETTKTLRLMRAIDEAWQLAREAVAPAEGK